LIHRHRVDAGQQHLISVGRQFCHARGAGHAAATADVFDDDGLRISVSRDPRLRAIRSRALPTPNGTTIVIGRVGHVCAMAATLMAGSTARTSRTDANKR
jgi:hypothetical protein